MYITLRVTNFRPFRSISYRFRDNFFWRKIANDQTLKPDKTVIFNRIMPIFERNLYFMIFNGTAKDKNKILKIAALNGFQREIDKMATNGHLELGFWPKSKGPCILVP